MQHKPRDVVPRRREWSLGRVVDNTKERKDAGSNRKMQPGQLAADDELAEEFVGQGVEIVAVELGLVAGSKVLLCSR
jgi:hypothetical protein